MFSDLSKHVLSLFFIASVCAFSCTIEEIQIDSATTSERIYATVNLPEEDATKTNYSENDPINMKSGLKAVWEAGDYFYAKTDASTTVRFDIISGMGTSKAVFAADVTDVDDNTLWTALLGRHAVAESSSLNCAYDSQNGQLSSLGDYDYIVASARGTSPAFNFSNGERLSYFLRIKLPQGVRYIEYCTAASWAVAYNSNNPVYDGHFDNVSMVDLGTPSSQGDVCYLAIPAGLNNNWIQERPKGVILTFFNASMTKSDGRALSADLTGKGGKIGTVDLTGMAMIDRPLRSDAISFGSFVVTMEKDVDGVNNYDNLSDYKRRCTVAPEWAPFNLGAKVSNPTATTDLYGEYFCWAEVNPRTSFSEAAYSLNGNNNIGGLDNFKHTQVGVMLTLGVTDGSTPGVMKQQRISGTKYDAARVRWGSEWRMPTAEEFYMFTGSSLTFEGTGTTANGFTTADETIAYYGRNVRGRSFTKDGQRVFFPYGGIYDTGYRYFGARAFYWSDTRIRATPSNGNLTNNPLRVTMTPGSMDFASAATFHGLPIRPVLNGKKDSGSATSPSLGEDIDGETTISSSNNLYGKITDSNGNPIAGVTVSDGYTCCSTDQNGVYQMKANTLARTVNVTIPAEYEIPIGADGRPAFYAYVTIPSNGQVEKNFILTRRSAGKGDRFTILAIADAHVTSANASKFSSAISDVQNTAVTLGTGIPVGDGGNAGEVIAVALGDQMWDDMTYASSIRSIFCGIRNKSGKTVPVFYTIGNHDHDNSAVSDYDAENVFVNNFGPTNYSFDIANAHVIVMDDIIRTASGSGTVEYKSGFTQAQVDWLKADIAKVSGASGKVVVFCVHAPLNTASAGDEGTQNAVMSALKNNFYNVHVLSGHTHNNNNNLYRGWAAKSGRNIFEHTLQSFAGYWWDADISYEKGSPAGYGVMTFAGNDLYAEYNKLTKEPASFQMRVYNGGDTYNKNSAWDEMMHGGARGYKEYTWDSPAKNKFVVRIWDAGASNDTADYWTVNLTYGGSTTAMTRVTTEIKDACAASYIFNKIKGTHGDANKTTDQIWYSNASFGSSFTITATHTMPSGWSATYTSTSYIGTSYKGFAYGERY